MSNLKEKWKKIEEIRSRSVKDSMEGLKSAIIRDIACLSGFEI